MNDREQYERAEALAAALIRLVRAHVDSLSHEDGLLISTVAVCDLFAECLLVGVFAAAGRPVPSFEFAMQLFHTLPVGPSIAEAIERHTRAQH